MGMGCYELDKTMHEFEVKLDQVAQCSFTNETVYVLPGAGATDNIFPIVVISFLAVFGFGQALLFVTRKKS